MSSIQPCKDTSEATELCESLGLYLKPVAKLNVCVQLPVLKMPGKTISNWEVMEKLKKMIRPDHFTVLKVSKTTLEFIRFEGEAESKAALRAIVSRLDGNTMKLSGFPDVLKIRSAEAKLMFPTRHDWDSHFRDAKNVDEMKPGERPDTIYFQNLPSKWFSDGKRDPDRPSQQILRQAFDVFGAIRDVDIPMLDPYRKDMNKAVGTIQTFSFSQDLTFEAYVQYKEYMGFVKAMDSLRGMKLMYKASNDKIYAASIKVDFDKTHHLSDKNVRRRCGEREKLIALEKEREERVRREREEEDKKKAEDRKKQEEEEKEREKKREEKLKRREERRIEREEKRRNKHMEKQKQKEDEEKARTAALEHRRRVLAERRIQGERLLHELFRRIEEKKKEEEMNKKMAEIELERKKQAEIEERKKTEEARHRQEEEKRQRERLQKQEQLLRERLVKNLKQREEKETEKVREQLRQDLAGRNILKSVLVPAVAKRSHSKVSSTKVKKALKVA